MLVFAVLIFFAVNNKQLNCLVEDRFSEKFIGNPSLTWMRFTDPRYNFSFSYPACWDVSVQEEMGIAFIDVSKWIRGNLYSIMLMQTSTGSPNEDMKSETVYIGRDRIKAQYTMTPNDFTGGADGKTTHVGTGYDKTYSFPVGQEKNLLIQYTYEQTVNGKKYTELEIGRIVADKLVQSIRMENSPLLKSASLYCPKCFK